MIEEAESARAAAAENDLENADARTEALLELETEDQNLTAAELAVDNVPPADEAELPESEAEENAGGGA